jgi:hypothetical protein
MANTYTLIASSTVGSGGSSQIDFTSIPSTYTDLLIKLSLRNTDAGGVAGFVLYAKFNTSSANFSWRFLGGDNATVFGGSGSDNLLSYLPGSSVTANTFAIYDMYIPNYASSNYKSISMDSSGENNANSNRNILTASLWSNSAAVNAVSFYPDAGLFAQYSTAYLYGIKNS